jgi:hypothetical protein
LRFLDVVGIALMDVDALGRNPELVGDDIRRLPR